VEREWKARRRAGQVQRWVRVGLVVKRLASSARVDRGSKVGALLDGAHAKRANGGDGDDRLGKMWQGVGVAGCAVGLWAAEGAKT
jgi:hypothetical protein